MSTNFPTALDAFNNPIGTDHLDDVPVLHSAQHTNINDAVEAIQAKTGINFSSTKLSLDFITNLLLMTQTEHPSGLYRECVYQANNKAILNTITWYTDSGKTIKLVEREYTYGSIKILPVKITLTLYDGTVSNVLKRTIEDTITYDRVFETSRSRIIT